MTGYEVAELVWEGTGRRTDWGTATGPMERPTFSTYQRRLWATAINNALKAVAFWKDPIRKVPVFLRGLEGELICKNTVPTDTVGASPTASSLTLTGTTYSGYVVQTSSEEKLIYGGTGGVYDVVGEFSTTPTAGDGVSLLKNWLTETELGTPTDYYEPWSIYDLKNEKRLSRANRGERFITKQVSPGDPAKWYPFGDRVYFDTLLEEVYHFRVEYARIPDPVVTGDLVSTSTTELDLPGPLHYGVVLWVTEWALRQKGEVNEKYSTKKDFQDFMRSVQTQGELSFMRDDSYLKYKK